MISVLVMYLDCRSRGPSSSVFLLGCPAACRTGRRAHVRLSGARRAAQRLGAYPVDEVSCGGKAANRWVVYTLFGENCQRLRALSGPAAGALLYLHLTPADRPAKIFETMQTSKTFNGYFSKPATEARHDDPETIVRGMAPGLWKVALKMKRPLTWETEDVLQVGLLAALECAPRFEPSRGVAFGAFARACAISAMKRAVSEGWGAVRIPQSSNIRNNEEVQEAKRRSAASVSLNALSPYSGGLYESLIGEAENICDRVDVMRALDKLPARARYILARISAGFLLREIAEAEGMPRQTLALYLASTLERCLGPKAA